MREELRVQSMFCVIKISERLNAVYKREYCVFFFLSPDGLDFVHFRFIIGFVCLLYLRYQYLNDNPVAARGD